MTSNYIHPSEAFVWVWLPNNTESICAGRIRHVDSVYQFTYSKSYLENLNAIPLSPFELPLKQEIFIPTGMNNINSCLRDAAPDAWGRRVINNEFNFIEASELDYMLLSGSDRIGALDFQTSPSKYTERINNQASIEDLMKAAECVDKNMPIPKNLQEAILHGTSIGGARPKVLLHNKNGTPQYIAKFSSSSDTFSYIKSEFICMRLAKLAGINVANVELQTVLGKDVLLVERFDRTTKDKKLYRKIMLSGLSILGLNELEARYASYPDLAEKIRQRFEYPKKDLLELYKRLVFNVLIGNTDDHARNHSAFWDGKNLNLTPAYDLCPQARIGFETTQGMSIDGSRGNISTLKNVASIASQFQISPEESQVIIDELIQSIKENWTRVCKEANFTIKQQNQVFGVSILNPFCFD